MSVNCLHPVIIPNNVNRYNTRKRHYIYYYLGKRVLYPPTCSTFRQDAPEITDEVLDTCYYCDTLTGDCFPMYLQVPCNKCIICKNKKTREWANRMVCESQMYKIPPLFVTLTYNDEYLPYYGIEKRDVQLFLKRLRERLDYLGYSEKLRYVFCGEYGSKSQRPHYHGIIWNMPSLPIQSLLHLIENAWAYQVTIEKYRTISKDHKFYRFIVPKRRKQYFHRLGFAYVKIAHNNSAYYVGKYMFKAEDNTPKGKNPNFFLSSRNHGIGYDWLRKNEKWYQENPNAVSIEFTNTFPDIRGKNAGKFCKFEFPMPTYFSNYIFPSGSRVYPPEVYRAYRMCQENLYNLASLECLCPQYKMEEYFKDCVDKINSSYHFNILSPLVYHPKYQYDVYYQLVDYNHLPDFSLDERNINLGRFMEYYDICLGRFQLSFDFLRNFMLQDYDYFTKLELHDIRQMYVSEYMEKQDKLDVKTQAYKLQKDFNKLKSKDMY